jgi:hypothetical protein
LGKKKKKRKVGPKPLRPRNAPRQDLQVKPGTRLEEVLQSARNLD